ncbi:MAG: excinuclease ABC subunit UvrA, partial [Rhabdochlamydiaceae bacterium]
MSNQSIFLKGVKVHNLKNVNLHLKSQQLIVFTGVSGSGKSSLAFDTIYVEGQRRYIESLSSYARRQIGDMSKPDAEHIEGVSPTVAIEQKTTGRTPRSTVGTMTGIYDYLRVLFARLSVPHCPVSQEPVSSRSLSHILAEILVEKQDRKLIILAPVLKNKKGEFKEDFLQFVKEGFTRIRLDGEIVDLSENLEIDKQKTHDIDLVIDRLVLTSDQKERLTESLTLALEKGKGVVTIFDMEEQREILYSTSAFSEKSGLSYPSLEPHDFSFNHPEGMCPHCQGLGETLDFDLEKVIQPDLSLSEDACVVASSYKTVKYGNIYNNLARLYRFDVTTPWKNLPIKAQEVFLYGTENKWTKMEFVHPHTGTTWSEYIHWKGVLAEAKQRFSEAKSETFRHKMKELMTEQICSSCQGSRLKPYPTAARLRGRSIHDLCSLSIEDMASFFHELELSAVEYLIGHELKQEILQRLSFLKGVGLNYLSLNRTSPTLSGGESQRVRLASQIGSGLVGATYVLDEPSIGLHPRDNVKLLDMLKNLKNKGNTVIVVEHDEETIKEADYIVDVGPLAGSKGGYIVAEGHPVDFFKETSSLTVQYLTGIKKIEIPEKRRVVSKDNSLFIKGAEHHNLKKIDAHFPLNVFIGVTGVSGSGKSSLISDTLFPYLSNQINQSHLKVGSHQSLSGYEKIQKVIGIDQTPIGRSPRSNPATYIKVFDDIRDLFSQLPESVVKGYQVGRFSFNVKEGSCPHCTGMGMIKIDMDFLEDEWVECVHCKGSRFDHQTLAITYKNKNISEVLDMSVEEAFYFFESIPSISKKLSLLMAVGLDYMKLGQPSPTLSGGEAQRIKLAKELARPHTSSTFYILDEPTTGLHFEDIAKLNKVLQALVDKGNTVLVIEHNMDLIKTVDWVIDLGPEAGQSGGFIIGEGTPETIAEKNTPTGVALKKALYPHPFKPKLLNQMQDADLQPFIEVKGACQNNLKSLSVSIPRDQLTICTGPSGSGKSSFAFETLYAEGQRRYIDSLSNYAKQFVKQMPKAKVEFINGLSAAIAIEQKHHAGNPRSTLGTITEIYDYLRIIFAYLGQPYCPETKELIQTITPQYIVDKLLSLKAKTKCYLLTPLKLNRQETFQDLLDRLSKQGYLRIRLNGIYYEIDQENIPYEKNKKNELFLVIDRFSTSSQIANRLYEAIEKAASWSKGIIIAALEDEDLLFNLAFTVPSTGKSYPPITPHSFSFNTEHGMCMDCQGLGFQYGANLEDHQDMMELSIYDILSQLLKENVSKFILKQISQFFTHLDIDIFEPLSCLKSSELYLFLNGAKDHQNGIRWIGLNNLFVKLMKSTHTEVKDVLKPLLKENSCLSCQGSRLNPLARHVLLHDLSISEVCELSIEKTFTFLSHLDQPDFLKDTIEQLLKRLSFLIDIGLGYLSLSRSARSLSGGEIQRTYIAKQIGSGLTGCMYVLDEPSTGLHPFNNQMLVKALRQLKEKGNTLILVEHDLSIIKEADYILEFGPEGGSGGGKIIAKGDLKEIQANPLSLTGQYLNANPLSFKNNQRRVHKKYIDIKNGIVHNIKDINTQIPLELITCITGVSGSGKSSLVSHLIKPAIEQFLKQKEQSKEFSFKKTIFKGLNAIDKLIVLEQIPIGQTNRADITTYTDLLTPLRSFFSSLAGAKTKGLQPKNFSFNHKKGMCLKCFGIGTKTISLQFLPSVKIECEACQGFRLNPQSLQVFYKEKHLGHIFRMTIKEAKFFFDFHPKISKMLDILASVGLSYIKLGQDINT